MNRSQGNNMHLLEQGSGASSNMRRVRTSTLVFIAVGALVVGFIVGGGLERIADRAPGLVGSDPVGVNAELTSDISTDKVQQVYDEIRENFDGELDYGQLVEATVNGLVEGTGDQHTDYMSPEEARDFRDSLNGDLVGIGAYIEESEGYIAVRQPIEGSPADKAGLKPGDMILEIDGESSKGLSASEAAIKIRGDSGTQVELLILSEGQESTQVVTREEIAVPSVSSELKSGIGYIKLSRFENDSYGEIVDSWDKLSSEGAKSLVLDLRGNGGGYLNAAEDIAGLWLNPNQIILSQRRGGELQSESRSQKAAIFGDVKTIVLVDGYSASASEILLGALKDNGYAQSVGVMTYGKGSVQNIFELDDGSLVKITQAHWYTPNGTKIDGQGIEPDFVVENSDSDSNADVQLEKAIELAK